MSADLATKIRLGLEELATVCEQLVKPGKIPLIDPKTSLPTEYWVPVAFSNAAKPQAFNLAGCRGAISEFMFRCEWEAKPNRAAVTAFHDEVDAALPLMWSMETGERLAQRYAAFTSPSGEITVEIRSPAMRTRLVPVKYCVTLMVHHSASGF